MVASPLELNCVGLCKLYSGERVPESVRVKSLLMFQRFVEASNVQAQSQQNNPCSLSDIILQQQSRVYILDSGGLMGECLQRVI